ncbi:MAG: glycosyltransferase family 4 protein [Chloroflexota bacterium]
MRLAQEKAPRLVPLLRLARGLVLAGRSAPAPQPIPSDGTVERCDIDIMHFTTQSGFLTDIPTIYQPWDLQHLHYPQFFSARERETRESRYRALCNQAALIVVPSEWGKRDLMSHYRLPPEKVEVVPIAPAVEAYPLPTQSDLAATKVRHHLPGDFIFYPAQTWVHKNHLALLEALAIVRERYHMIVPLVCSGRKNGFYPQIQQRVRELNLKSLVSFVGFVSPLEMQCLYRLARAMVFPSKFEGWGMPLSEAFLAGVPAACSNVTSLPEQAGDAALLFDPDRPDEIADAIHRLWTDQPLRQSLVERGKRNVSRFSWERTARIFRAHYRRIAGRSLTDEDRVLLPAPTLL